MPKPHPENVPGDFYVEDGCCTRCAIPFDVAPDFFAWSAISDDHCFVCKQPTLPQEVDVMIGAMKSSEVRCIRYKGRDKSVQIRIVQSREGAQCDELPDDLRTRVLREQGCENTFFQRFFEWVRKKLRS